MVELCLTPNSYVAILTLSISECDTFGDKVFKEVIRINEVIRMGPNKILLVSL